MYRNYVPQDIADYWSDDVQHNIEYGSTPVLELGVSSLITDGTAALLALQSSQIYYSGVSQPVVPCGGTGPEWIAAMMHPLPANDSLSVAEPQTLYAGSNLAEYFATVSLLNAALESTTRTRYQTDVIPASQYHPNVQPGLALPWESLPFERTSGQRRYAYTNRAIASTEYEPKVDDPVRDWLAWIALLLALGLILLAIVL